MGSKSESGKAQFANFELDVSSGELTQGSSRTRLQSQPLLLLQLLLASPNEVVSREQLRDQLWPDKSFGDFDHGLNKAVAKLRDALHDTKDGPRLIETIPRRGYRLNAEVKWAGSDPQSATQTTTIPPTSHLWLNRLTIGVLLTVLMIAAVWTVLRIAASRTVGAPEIRSIAVLPFQNLSNDPEQQYFADGITDELITDLSFARSLRVTSRESTFGFDKSHLSISEIAEKLRVDAVIDGGVLRVDQNVRITIRLIAANPEKIIWTSTYRGNLSDTGALQNRIATEAVKQIRVQMSPADHTRLDIQKAINPEANDEYLRGRFFLAQETEQEHKAIPHLERATQLEPKFAAAYAALGEAWAMEGVWSEKGNRETSAKALEFSQKAVTLDPNSSEAFSSLGHSLMQSRRWNEGESALRHAIELDPNNPYAHQYLAILLCQKGQVEESLLISRELSASNPVAAEFQRLYANMLYRARRYDQAIAQCLAIIELSPNHLATYSILGNALVEKGRFEEAREAFRRRGPVNPGLEAWIDVRAGHIQHARRILSLNPKLVNEHASVARYILGEKEEGLSELNYLTNVKWAVKTYNLRNDPTFDPMRNDPRFDAIVRKSGLLD